jgi:uncharacterized integral membrane protein
MIFLGLVVAAAAVGVGVGVVLDNTTNAQLTFFGHAVPGVTSTWHIFLAGAVLAMVFMAGVIVIALGIGRAVRVRRELRDLRDEHEESLTTLEMEKRHLQRELARVRQQPAGQAHAQSQTPGQTNAQIPAQPRPQAQPQAQVRSSLPQRGAHGSKVSSSPFFDPSS